MKHLLLYFATFMLIMGYLIHAMNFAVMNMHKMSIAMVLFAAAMYFLFV